jgi:hypothetical protein
MMQLEAKLLKNAQMDGRRDIQKELDDLYLAGARGCVQAAMRLKRLRSHDGDHRIPERDRDEK